jgi:glyoxylase-like metal-dependent hydrolase (beta-lactamase superfamily II)
LTSALSAHKDGRVQRPYAIGLQEIGRGVHAYLQPDGTWGLSNAGLVTDGGEALLVDTLFDLARTGEMLAAMRAAEPAAARIGTVVNTHHNGDHCYGNELLEGAEIIASVSAAQAMRHEPPALLHGFLAQAPALGPLGAYLLHCFGRFQFAGVRQVLPTRTFTGALALTVGATAVDLVEVGPAHTPGDVIVHVPSRRVVFTGDVLFVDVHPVMWAGPVGAWLAACERIVALDPEVVVPGHGPIADLGAVREMSRYLAYVRDEAKKRHAAGMPLFDAAADIALTDWSSWGDAERIVVNVASIYRELDGDPAPLEVPQMFAMMARLKK